MTDGLCLLSYINKTAYEETSSFVCTHYPLPAHAIDTICPTQTPHSAVQLLQSGPHSARTHCSIWYTTLTPTKLQIKILNISLQKWRKEKHSWHAGLLEPGS